jgi:hypothetical protein
MRNGLQVLGGALILLSSAALIGCGGDTTAGADSLVVGQFQPGQGQSEAQKNYPAGPYGIGVHSVIADFSFVGFVNSTADSSALQETSLADFYNPTGAGQYPAGSQYSGDLPKALLIDVSAYWCGPCNDESHTMLPGQYATLHPQGAEFVLTLADGPSMGVAATPNDLLNWTNSYHEEFPAVIDPEYTLAALFSEDAFPANMMINTQNMRVCHVTPGEPQAADWAKFQAILDGTDSCD